MRPLRDSYGGWMRSESHVLDNIEAVIALLHRLLGWPPPAATGCLSDDPNMDGVVTMTEGTTDPTVGDTSNDPTAGPDRRFRLQLPRSQHCQPAAEDQRQLPVRWHERSQ